MYQRGSDWTDLREISYWVSVEKIQILLRSVKNVGHSTWQPKCVLLLPAFNHHARAFFEIVSGSWSVLLSVRLSACISTAPNGRNYVGFDTGKFDMNFRMWLKSEKKYRALYVTLLPARANRYKRALLERNGIRLLGYLRSDKYYPACYNAATRTLPVLFK
jgi:hypothetical protein